MRSGNTDDEKVKMNMQISDYIIDEKMKIMDAMKVIDENGRGIVFVCKDGSLRAVLSDGDVRRYIIAKGNLENEVRDIANYKPKSVKVGSVVDLKSYMKKNKITAVPVVDEEGCILRICFDDGTEVYNINGMNVPIVIMAGGKGTRLYPYTQILPKPLIPIGNKTITEHIIDRFLKVGCTDITMIVNYKKRFIETYFAEETEYSVKFVEEKEFYGTGGGLKLLKNFTDTFFMTNCDILLDADYADIYRKHKKEQNIITMVCAKKREEIPYGTIEKDDTGKLVGLTEKPVFSFLVNTGFYVIEPEFLDKIPSDTFIHITDIIQKCMEDGDKVGVYEVEEEAWMDMGQMDELEKMRRRLENTEN